MEILSERLAAARSEQAELERRLAERQALVQEALALAQQNEALAARTAALGRSSASELAVAERSSRPASGGSHAVRSLQSERATGPASAAERRDNPLDSLSFSAAEAALEDFVHAASHDLQAPLRAVANFAAWISEELPPSAEVVHQHVRRLLDRIDRLRNLHRDLLMYARAGREQGEVQCIRLPTLAQETWQRLVEGDARLHLEQLPEGPLWLAADPLVAVIQALFDNALHHHDRGACQVVVRAHLSRGLLVLDVEDDGPGIEPRFAEQVFRVLETLRPRDAGSGSGMGLAIARKRAESAGGRVSLVPHVGRGAHFRVEWPIEDPPGGPDV